MILENVKNFARHNDGKTLGTVLSILNEINYHVEYKVLNASMFGVPQARKRIFLVCIRKDLKNTLEIPEKNNLNSNLEDVLIPDEEVNLKCYNDSFQIEEFVKNLNQSNTITMGLDSAVLGAYKRQLVCEPAIEKIETEVEVSRIPFNIDLGWSELIVEEVDCIAEHCFYASGNLSIRFGSLAKKVSTDGGKDPRSVSVKK